MTRKIAIAGAGLIGKRHIEAINAIESLSLAAIVDPQINHDEYSAPSFSDLDQMIESVRPDGIVIATPNDLHIEQCEWCLIHQIPFLVEKPLGTDLNAARDLVTRVEACGLPALVGHHRRYTRIVEQAKALIDSAKLGKIVALHTFSWLAKPANYFEPSWRRSPGAGPILINMIHDIELMHHFCGNVTEISALRSNAQRGFDVEDTAVALLRFDRGALGTFTASDAAVGPWSWELTAGENPAYCKTDESYMQISGTKGAIELPTLRTWSFNGDPHWHGDIAATGKTSVQDNAIVSQMKHFGDVCAGSAQPRVPLRDGLRALETTLAISKFPLNDRP